MTMHDSNSYFNHRRKNWLTIMDRLGPLIGLACAFMFAVLALTVLVTKVHVTVVMVLILTVFLVVALFYWPEPGTILVLFAIYSNLAVVAYKFHGLPQILAASISLLLCVPLAVYWFVRREKFVIDYPWLLMLAFLASLFASLMVAVDIDRGMEWIYTFLLEGLALYLIVINVVRRLSTLRSVIWALLVCGAFLGGLTLLQAMTQDYANNYGGLAQRNIEHWDGGDSFDEMDKVRLADRSSGPIGDPNRYAQIMLVLLPLGFFRIFDEERKRHKLFALVCTVLTLCGMLLTYSRGAFISLTVLVVVMTALRYIRFSRIALAAAGILVIIAVASPGYFIRMSSIANVQALFTKDASIKADGATRGRITEMLAAFNCYLDHPVVGVGPGQYSHFYSVDYMTDPAIAFRTILSTRRAHTLYFEMMAELGTLGFAAFMAIVLLIMTRLWRLRKHFTRRSRKDLANIASGFWLAIFAYMFSSIFLHFAYQRYYWILLAIAGAAVHILQGLAAEEDATEQTEPAVLAAPELEKVVS